MAPKNPSPASAPKRARAEVAPATEAYLALIRAFPLRPIEDDSALDAAIAVIDSLLDRDDLDASERDYLDVLGGLVEVYEEAHVDWPATDDASLVAFLMEQKGVTQADVSRSTGIVKSTVSQILSGKRRLTREHIEALAGYFHLNPSVFLSVDRAAAPK
jgi:HTH-type transcriptional regulator / antitoxin HigA